MSDASGRLNSDRANREWIEAKEALIQDKEFLDEQENAGVWLGKQANVSSRELDDRINATRGS